MKRITFIFALLSTALSLQARTINITTAYTGSKQFDQIQLGATLAPTLNTLAGLEAKLTNERGFKDPIYSVAVPVMLEMETMRLSLRPFYYFKNKSDLPGVQDSYAFGLNAQLRMTLRENEVEESRAYAFLGASVARQTGSVSYEDGTQQNRNYLQAAYKLGLSQILYNAFGFEIEGVVYQYPDGVSSVTGIRSVLDQQELAHTQTFEVSHQLAKYTLGARMSRLWAENGSSAFIGYRYGEFHHTDSEHSFVGGISFRITRQIAAETAYNHVRTVNNQNKRDIGYVRLIASF